MENSNKEIIILIDMLNKKSDLLSEILNITHKQTDAIKDSKFDKLDNLIMIKQTYIDKIDNIDASYAKQFSKIKNIYNVGEISQIDIENDIKIKFKQLTQQLHEKAENIFKIDKKNSELINNNFQQVKSKLKDIKQGKKVTSNYYKQSIQTEGYFIDKGR